LETVSLLTDAAVLTLQLEFSDSGKACIDEFWLATPRREQPAKNTPASSFHQGRSSTRGHFRRRTKNTPFCISQSGKTMVGAPAKGKAEGRQRELPALAREPRGGHHAELLIKTHRTEF
jgi:hypothetical protein